MAKVVFYEKPGCGGNARQKALLRLGARSQRPQSAHRAVDRRSAEAFFGASRCGMVQCLFPRVKCGAVKPDD